MARPKATETRSKNLNLCLTPREYDVILQRAESVGLAFRPARYARQVLLKEQPFIREVHVEGFDQPTLQALIRIGVNLNQAVRALHTFPDRPIPDDLEPALRQIRTLIAEGRSV